MSRVLLVLPPLAHEELFVRGSKSSASRIPPLGLAYIAAYLREHGHTCRIIDGIAEPLPLSQVAEEALAYDVVGITVVSTYAMRAVELIEALKARPDCPPVVVGGPHVTALPESLLERGADYAVVGEGEVTMLELVEALGRGDGAIRDIPGLVFRDQGEVVYTGVRELIEPLDAVPLPAREILPMHLYSSSIARATQQPSHSMLASRGCPGACTFCNKKTFGSRMRYFSVERIVEEFFLLRDTYGARDVAVWDDNFVSSPEVAIAVCDELVRRDFDISWSVEARIDAVGADVLDALKRAGCTYIAYGIESGSQRMLDRINKRITLDQIRESIRMTKQTGMHIRGYFMLGFPTETRAEMDETIRFAIELDVELASFTLFVPLPGTPEYRHACETGDFPDPEYYFHRILPEFNFPDAPLYVPEGMTAGELMAIHRSAYNRYYLRPSKILRTALSKRSPGDLLSMFKGGLTLVQNALCRK
jgi:radical SAM superfamily enzyme YgiQ (UPF0313 family)